MKQQIQRKEAKQIDKETAKRIFEKRRTHHPGAWIRHSEHVAFAAEKIACRLSLDSELAYCMGLLHDIGRSFTDGQFQHIVCGYSYMIESGYPEIARICLTHSFAVQTIYSYVGKIDVSKEDQRKYQSILLDLDYTNYDRLIQLCDAISTPEGFILPEQRFVRLAFKYGFNEFTIEKWKAVLHIKEEISQRIGRDVNAFLRASS